MTDTHTSERGKLSFRQTEDVNLPPVFSLIYLVFTLSGVSYRSVNHPQLLPEIRDWNVHWILAPPCGNLYRFCSSKKVHMLYDYNKPNLAKEHAFHDCFDFEIFHGM